MTYRREDNMNNNKGGDNMNKLRGDNTNKGDDMMVMFGDIEKRILFEFIKGVECIIMIDYFDDCNELSWTEDGVEVNHYDELRKSVRRLVVKIFANRLNEDDRELLVRYIREIPYYLRVREIYLTAMNVIQIAYDQGLIDLEKYIDLFTKVKKGRS